MAEILPQQFPEQPDSAIASYSFSEFATNEGIVSFYGYTSFETGNLAVSGSLTTNSATYSHTLYTAAPSCMTFDTNPLNKAVLLKGTASFFLPTSITDAGTGWYNIDVQKVSSSGVPTTLLSLSGGQLVSAGQAYKVCAMKGTIPSTKISAGEKIRISGSSLGTGTRYLGHDPSDRDTGNPGATPFGDDAIASVNGRTGTRMVVLLPFKVDV